MNFNIIGGADGPTSIFIAGKLGAEWFSVFGLSIVIMLLLPNLVYFLKFRNKENHCRKTAVNILEQIGRYACMFFMVFNIGIGNFGYSSIAALFAYLCGNVLLLLIYLVLWFFYLRKKVLWVSMALAVIPVVMFLYSGVMQRYILLIVSAVIFGIGHIYITYQSAKV